MYDLKQVAGGWIVVCIEGKHVAYLGRDGYWARHATNAVPFETRSNANAAIPT